MTLRTEADAGRLAACYVQQLVRLTVECAAGRRASGERRREFEQEVWRIDDDFPEDVDAAIASLEACCDAVIEAI